MLQSTNNKIRQGFSLSARQYDLYSSLHREIADKFWARLSREVKPSALLDIGCGTGYLTVKAREDFPLARIVGLDFAQGMLDIARLKHEAITWLLADGNHLPFSSESFDLVVSNLAYQWSENLSRSFSEARRVLAPGGVLAFTLFGFQTCQELFQTLDEASGKVLQFSRLPDQIKVRDALMASGFKSQEIDSEGFKIEFKDMFGLLNWFKYIGAPHLRREGFLGAEIISKAALIYREKFSYLKGVGATFEVIRVYAKK